jgi:hypothetical protein
MGGRCTTIDDYSTAGASTELTQANANNGPKTWRIKEHSATPPAKAIKDPAKWPRALIHRLACLACLAYLRGDPEQARGWRIKTMGNLLCMNQVTNEATTHHNHQFLLASLPEPTEILLHSEASTKTLVVEQAKRYGMCQ